MSGKLKILLVEDSERDAELVLRELRSAGLDCETLRVDSESGLRSGLRDFRPQIVISDFSMPGFNGMAALAICRERATDIPFIFMSGTVGEGIAVEAMKAGANDYVMKSNLARLGPALKRELREAAIREERRIADVALRRAQAMAMLAHVITGPDGAFEGWSETLPRLIGVQSAGMPRSTREWLEIVHPEERGLFRGTCIEAAKRGVRMSVEYRLHRADGAWVFMQQVMEPLPDTAGADGKMRWFNTLQDVTGQKLAAAELRASEERYRATFEQAAVGVVHSSVDGDILMVNPAFCAMSGYSRAEAIQLNIRDLTHAQDLERSVAGRSRMLSGTGKPYERELRLVRKDGSEIWASTTTSLVRAPDDRPLHFISVMHDISERKRAEQELQRFRMAMDVTADSIYLTDPVAMRFVYLNSTACARLGYSREQLLQMGPQDVIAMDRAEISREYDEVIAAGDPGLRHERRFVRSDGGQGWTELHRRALRTEGGTLIVTVGRDITERKQADERIRRLNRIYAVLSGINALIVRATDRDELFRESCRIAVEAGGFRLAWAGLVDREEMRVKPVVWHGPGEDYVTLMPLKLDGAASAPRGLAGQAILERKAAVSDDMTRDPRITLQKEARERGFRALAILPLLVGGEAVGVLALYAGEAGFFDADEMKLLNELAGDLSFALEHMENAQQLEYLAFYDSLTGVANRTLFLDRLNQSIHAAAQSQGKFALVLADVERLRTINESLGRQAGDALLKKVAERLERAAGRTEVGRVSADQFAVVLPAVKGRSEASRIVQTLAHSCFDEPFEVNETKLRISAKTGIALYPNDGADAETLLKHAEAALRKGKETGERFAFYTPDLTEQTAATLTLENKLRQALDNEEFVLHYQPKVEIETRSIVGVEALIRWQSPELGLVPPMKFIPLMEETGLILEVGAWALARAVTDHASWMRLGLPAPRVAVNVSPIQLRQRDFVSTVEAAIRGGAAPPRIDLEITESLVMEDIEGNIQKLKEVRALGLAIAIDDFGTGYSSLGYLAKLPVQALKIDRSFIITMLKDPDTMALVQMIISLAHSLRLKVVAEGVDSEEQAKFLRLLRCDEMQGYLFSKPVPFEAMTALLKPAART